MAEKVKVVNPLSEKATAILETLGKIKSGSMNDIKEAGNIEIVSGHFTALRKRDFVSTEKAVDVCPHCGSKKEYTIYTITEAGLAELDKE